MIWSFASIAVSLLVRLIPTNAAECTAATFGVLATSPTVSLCMKDSNIPLLTMGSAPTSEQLRVVCQTPTCRQLLQLLVDLNAPECTIPLAGRLRLHADLIDPTVAFCKQAGLPLTPETLGSHGSSVGGNETVKETEATVPPPTSASFDKGFAARTSLGLVAVVAAYIFV